MQLAGAATANEIGAAFKFGALEGVITAVFARTDEIHHDPHSGFDLAFPEGTAFPCLAAGTVVLVGVDGQDNWGNIFGNSCIIDHGDGTRANYGHFRDPLAVKVGDAVAVGQILGIQGSTGFSTGDHVHISLAKDDNPWFNKDADGGVSRLLDPVEFLGGDARQ